MPTPSYDNYVNKYRSPNNTEYWYRDEEARELIAALEASSEWLGVTTTTLSDGLDWLDTTTTPYSVKPIVVNGVNVTPKNGNITSYNNKEFIIVITLDSMTGNPTAAVWQEFGDLSSLGTLAYKNSATGSTSYTPAGSVTNTSFTGTKVQLAANVTDGTFTGTQGSVSVSGTPSGSVSTPTISVASAGATSSFAKTITTAAPGQTAPTNPVTILSVENHVLIANQVGYTTGNAKTGDASYSSSQPTFSGNALTSTGTFTPEGSVSGTTAEITATASETGNYTPQGSVSAGFTGTAATISITAS